MAPGRAAPGARTTLLFADSFEVEIQNYIGIRYKFKEYFVA